MIKFGNPTLSASGITKGGRKKMEAKAAIRKGDKAPGFTLPDSSGKTVQLDDFKGRRLLVYFFPKAGTSG